MKNKKLAVNMTVYFVANMVVNVLFYVYQLLMSRFLSVDAYGLLNSMMSFYTIISIPMTAISFFVGRHISLYLEQGSRENIDGFRHSMIKNINKFFPAMYLLLCLFIPLLSRLMKVYDNYVYFLVPIFTAIVYSYITLFKAVIYGERKFNFYSILSILELVARIIGSLALIYMGWSYVGGFLGVVVGGLSNLLLIYIFDKSQFVFKAPETHSIDYKDLQKFVLPSFLMTLVTILLNNIDILLAKSFLSDFEVGIYSTLSVLSRIIVAILGIYINFGATYFVNTKKNKKIIIFIYAIFFFTGILSVVSFYLIPHFLVHTLFGDRYIMASQYLGKMGLMTFAYSIVNLLLVHMLSFGKDKSTYAALGGMILLPIILLFVNIGGIGDFVNAMLMFYLVYTLFFFLYLGFSFIKNKNNIADAPKN